jgi:hypothetical protein
MKVPKSYTKKYFLYIWYIILFFLHNNYIYFFSFMYPSFPYHEMSDFAILSLVISNN